jgi:uncharacterized membrane protein YeaQ/YmgE (transglycosylase-associated protein family)
MRLLWWIIVGLVAGWTTGKIMRGSGYGPLMDIVIGVIGAIVGGWIMRAVGFQGQGGMIYTILVAIGGAILLTWLWRLMLGPRRETGAGAPNAPRFGVSRVDESQGRDDLRKVA